MYLVYLEAVRVARLFFGLFLFAVGIVMTIHANLGNSPWEVFNQGVSLHIGSAMGTASVLVAAAIIGVSVLMKEHIGFGTLCNMVIIGMSMNFLMAGSWIPVVQGMAQGLLMMTGGLFVIAFASFFYMGAGYGSGPRDSLMVVMTKRTGWPVGACRCVIEGTALILGWLLGGRAGIGTAVSVFGAGIAVQVVFSLLRFDVKTIPQESFGETCARFRNFIARRAAA